MNGVSEATQLLVGSSKYSRTTEGQLWRSGGID